MSIKKYEPIKIKSFKPTLPSTYDPSKQVEGYKARIEGSGLDFDKDMDKRSFLEKVLNLTPDQNVLFDIFEVIERPQRAFFGGWKAAQEGGDVLQGIKSGITGKDVVQFKEIMHNMGMEDSGKSFGIDDVVGFLGEVFLDPIDLALIPLTGGASLAAKGVMKSTQSAAKAVGASADVIKVMGAAKDFGKMHDAVKAVGASDEILSVIRKAGKTKRISPLQATARGTKKGIQKVAGLTDVGIQKILPKLDAKLNIFDASLIEKGSERLAKKSDLTKRYSDIKEQLTRNFNIVKGLPEGVWDAVRKTEGATSLTKAKVGALRDVIFTKIDNVAAQAGMDSKKLGKELRDIIEYKSYKPTTTSRRVLEKAVKGEGALDTSTKKIMEDIIESVKKEFPVYKDLELSDLFGKQRLGAKGKYAYFVKDQPYLKKVLGTMNNSRMSSGLIEKLDKTITAPRFYNKVDVKRFDNLTGKTNLDKGLEITAEQSKFNKLLDDVTIDMDEMNNIINKLQKTNIDYQASQGMLKHVATQKRKALGEGVEIGSFTTQEGSKLAGNVQTFAGRKYQTSAQEANVLAQGKLDFMRKEGLLSNKQLEFWADKDNMKVFEDSLQASVNEFIELAPKYAKDHRMMDDVLVKSFMKDSTLVRKLGVNEKYNDKVFEKVASIDLKRKLEHFSKNIDSPAMEQMIKDLPEGSILIEKNIFQAIGVLGDGKKAGEMLKILDTTNNLFKRFKLLSPGFQMRNLVGNLSNIYLSGANMRKVIGEMRYADEIIRKGDNLLKKSASGSTMTKAEKKMIKHYEDFVGNNFHNIGNKVHDIPDKMLKKLKDDGTSKSKWGAPMRLNAAMNEGVDKRYRLALMMYAEKNPEILAKLGVDSPANVVRRVLFDPADLSAYEREVAKRLVPFYTFAKKNLAYQMQNVFANPTRYKRLKKTIDQTWEMQGIDTDDIEGYKKENFWIAIPGLTKDGKYTALKVNLPLGDLADFLDNPLKKLVSSIAPAIRAPLETVVNRQAFTGRPISEFKGQKGFMIPELGRKAEYLLGQAGLDVPIAFGADIARTAVQGVRGELEGIGGLGVLDKVLGRSVTSKGDIAKAKLSKDYEELNQVRELMKYYRQEGVDILTLAEIENKNNVLSSLEARLSQLYGRK